MAKALVQERLRTRRLRPGLARRFWPPRTAARSLGAASRAELKGDLSAACAAYRLAVNLGCRDATSVRLRLVRLLRVAADDRVDLYRSAVGGIIGNCESQLRLALRIGLSCGSVSGDVRTLLSRLALLLCQEGRQAEAEPLLELGGWSHRLGQWILCYSVPPAIANVPSSESAAISRLLAPVVAFDDALPDRYLQVLQGLLKRGGSFWTYHGYNEISGSGQDGYFSYLHSLRGPQTTALDLVIRYIFGLAQEFGQFPGLRDATAAEWWAHCRPHSGGHQLHFDSDDEDRSRGVRHPICTAVVFVAGGEQFGGPTLVTDQRLRDGRLASTGWLVHPRVGRVALCDGAVLHGVIPGKGLPPAGTAPGTRRITWMVTFWKDKDHLASSGGSTCRALPHPSCLVDPAGHRCAWRDQLALHFNCGLGETCVSQISPRRVQLPFGNDVWELVRKSRADVETKTGQRAAECDYIGDKELLPAYRDCFQVGYDCARVEWD
mmetsp:Transcript_69868/g.227363  ORF Transcript_69868/g.227363 Transcript_69868/m.227363 type:complete len:492 (+) Transcript_69868:114-1589(+)